MEDVGKSREKGKERGRRRGGTPIAAEGGSKKTSMTIHGRLSRITKSTLGRVFHNTTDQANNLGWVGATEQMLYPECWCVRHQVEEII